MKNPFKKYKEKKIRSSEKEAKRAAEWKRFHVLLDKANDGTIKDAELDELLARRSPMTDEYELCRALLVRIKRLECTK